MITDPAIEEYCIQHSTPPSETQMKLIASTQARLPQAARMQVGALEGRFLTLITQLSRANSVLEFGTFTGYSALAFAAGLPESGRVTTLDLDPHATQIAKEHWSQSEHGAKIELILGKGLDSAQKLQSEIQSGQRTGYDLIFIDADKGNYLNYYEASLKLLNPGGAILVDNVLWSGAVLNPEDPSDHSIVNFNTHIKNDSRVQKVMLPIRDGLYLIRVL